MTKTCECGHDYKEHREGNGGNWFYADNNPDEAVCWCTEFVEGSANYTFQKNQQGNYIVKLDGVSMGEIKPFYHSWQITQYNDELGGKQMVGMWKAFAEVPK